MKQEKFDTGTYQIINLVNGKRYIGSAVSLYNRNHVHVCTLEKNNHKNRYLQNAYNRHGKDNFKFEVIMHCPKEYLIFFEQIHINKYDFENELYNLSPTAGNSLGHAHSDETKEKIRKAKSGIKASEKTKKRMSKAQRCRKHSVETRVKISKSNKGKIISKATKEKIRKSKLGIKLSDHHKEQIRKSCTGKIVSEETKIKMRGEGNPAKRPDVREKISQNRKDKYSGDKNHMKQEKYRKMFSILMSGERNPMYGRTGAKNRQSRLVNQIEIHSNKVIKEWAGIANAGRTLCIDPPSIINVCKGKQKTAGGFKWKYADKD